MTDWTVKGKLRGISRKGAKVEVQEERHKGGNTQAVEAEQDAVHTQEWYTFKYLILIALGTSHCILHLRSCQRSLIF